MAPSHLFNGTKWVVQILEVSFLAPPPGLLKNLWPLQVARRPMLLHLIFFFMFTCFSCFPSSSSSHDFVSSVSRSFYLFPFSPSSSDALLLHFAGVRVTFFSSLSKVCKNKVRPLIERVTISIRNRLRYFNLKPRNLDEGLKMINERTAELIGSRKRPSPCRMDIHAVQMHPKYTLQGSGSLLPSVF